MVFQNFFYGLGLDSVLTLKNIGLGKCSLGYNTTGKERKKSFSKKRSLIETGTNWGISKPIESRNFKQSYSAKVWDRKWTLLTLIIYFQSNESEQHIYPIHNCLIPFQFTMQAFLKQLVLNLPSEEQWDIKTVTHHVPLLHWWSIIALWKMSSIIT